MSGLAIFFAGAFFGAGITFLSMCLAFCASQPKTQTDQEKEDN